MKNKIKTKKLAEVFEECPFVEEVRLHSLARNLQADMKLRQALIEEQMIQEGKITQGRIFRRPDLHIMFRAVRTQVKA